MGGRGRALAAVALLAAVSAVGGLRWLAPAPRVGTPPEPPGSAEPARPASSVAPLALPAHARVVVFAPHPDDETVGVGGLLFRLAHGHTPLRVVFVTNGDGYRRALEQDFAVERPTDADYVALGELRQREALAALAHLGVARRDVRFLGFPDGGLAELWRAHWLRTHPYTSPYTKESSPPDAEGVGYDGQDLTSIVSGILRDFGPTVIVMPHPYAPLRHAPGPRAHELLRHRGAERARSERRPRACADRSHVPGPLPALARPPRPELRPRAAARRPAGHALERERARTRRARRQAGGARGVPQPARRDERLPAPLPLPERAVRHRRPVGARAHRGGALRRTA